MNNESLIEHIKETAALMHQASMHSHGIEQTQVDLNNIQELSKQLGQSRHGSGDRIGKCLSSSMAMEATFGVDAIRAGLSRIQFDQEEIRSTMTLFIKYWDELQKHFDFKTQVDAIQNGRKIQHINGCIEELRRLGVIPINEEVEPIR